MENFSDVAKSAWITDDGSNVFCVPMASVIHGFIYNKEIFEKLGLSEPATVEEFHAVLDAIKADGTVPALAMGTSDLWEAATMGFQNIGPNYWKGEEGRLGLIRARKSTLILSMSLFGKSWPSWKDYLSDGFQAQTYPNSQNLFTLGQAAIYPAGSWEIGVFEPMVDFTMGAFKPPLPEGADTCYISDHTDIALGMNAATKNPEAARTFLEWMTTPSLRSSTAMPCPASSPCRTTK